MNGRISANVSEGCWLRLRWLLLMCLAPYGWASGDQPIAAELELLAELRLPLAEDNKTYKFVPATTVEQGQEIYYTLRIRNPGTTPLENVAVVQALPSNTHYVPGSATGAGADIQFSADGGRSFAKPALQQAADSERLAKTAQYTHIRWQLRYPLAPKAVVLARFRAVFE